MPRNSKNKAVTEPPEFKSEAEEADWWASPEGQRVTEREFRRAIHEGTLKVYPGGMKIERTDPAVLQKLMDKAHASMTKAVSLRISTVDLEAAKRIAGEKGIGYQTVLKQAIRKGLRRV